ncbi:MAG: DEAD/DEAH box helicase family protein, partial [Treponema sp.]|nr:DEAD/DEAH box helicase family protein [Treponema sp.]
YNDLANTTTNMFIEGPSLEVCREKLFSRYGDRYQIMNYRTVMKGGFFGLFNREMIHVDYVVDDKYPSTAVPGRSMGRGGAAYPGPGQMSAGQMQDMAPYARGGRPMWTGGNAGEAMRNGGIGSEDFTAVRDAILQKQADNNPGAVSQLKQFALLKKELESLNAKIDSLSHTATSQEKHPSIVKIDDYLAQNEFTRSYIEKINARIRNEMTYEDLDDFEKVQNNVVEWIAESIRIAPKFTNKSKKLAHTIIIVGPTGVGKTTTVAKMAAKVMMLSKNSGMETPKILMIAADSMRVAAEQQLSRYASIMEVEVQRAGNSEELERLYKSYRNTKDFIFIDTSGYSPRDLENIAKLHTLLDVDGMKADIYLAISATTKAKDVEFIIRNYDSFNYRSVIITKCDETLSYGNVLSVLAEKEKSVSMVATGQKILNALKRAHPLQFMRYLSGFTVDRNRLIELYGPEEADEEETEN